METHAKSPISEAALAEAKRIYTDPNRSQFVKDLQVLLGLWNGDPDAPVERRELPARTWKPNDRWRALQGILRDRPDHDTDEMKARNRADEEEQNARKFGPQ